jgi:hypothetical protein
MYPGVVSRVATSLEVGSLPASCRPTTIRLVAENLFRLPPSKIEDEHGAWPLIPRNCILNDGQLAHTMAGLPTLPCLRTK